MKTKTNSKILLVIAVLLIISCIFNTRIVNATETAKNETNTQVVEETTPTPTAETPTAEVSKTAPTTDTLKLIDDTITVTQKESQFEELFDNGKVKQEIEKSVKEKLEKQDVDLTNYDVVFDFENNLSASVDIHKAIIYLQRKSDKNRELSKEITIQYSNSNTYNADDEKAVKNASNLVTRPWHSFGFDETIPENRVELLKKDMNDYITDKTVTYKVVEGVGQGFNYLSSTHACNIFFFKNDKCYVSKSVTFYIYREIIIPEDIRDTDEAYINYALPILQKECEGFVPGVLSIQRQNNNSQFYDIYSDDLAGNWVDCILIRKENTFMVYDGITISSNANVTLTTEKMESTSSHYADMQKVLKDKGYNNVLNAFEIKLSSGNIENGLELTFDVGTEYNGKQVMILHQKQDGTYEEFERTVENGRVKITVTELSPFMIALKGDRILDNEPKTGVVNYTILASVVAIISLGGLAVLKFKK